MKLNGSAVVYPLVKALKFHVLSESNNSGSVDKPVVSRLCQLLQFLPGNFTSLQPVVPACALSPNCELTRMDTPLAGFAGNADGITEKAKCQLLLATVFTVPLPVLT